MKTESGSAKNKFDQLKCSVFHYNSSHVVNKQKWRDFPYTNFDLYFFVLYSNRPSKARIHYYTSYRIDHKTNKKYDFFFPRRGLDLNGKLEPYHQPKPGTTNVSLWACKKTDKTLKDFISIKHYKSYEEALADNLAECIL